jgi:predicted dehydrogenase
MAIEGRGHQSEVNRIRLGMVGGGEGAFIGAVHRIAARLDDHYTLVAGAMSASPDKARRSGLALGLDPQRIYDNHDDMARREARLSDGIEAVSIVTPNHMHARVATAFLKTGVHVICDKPLTSTLEDAVALAKLADESGLIFAVTHNYTGYPLVRHAREMVRAGELGEIRVVQVEYPQDWLTEYLEDTGQKQAAWRTDPAQSGAGGCIGDIGTHAMNLVDFVTGLSVTELCAELTTFVPRRKLDDDAQILLRFANGARGMLWSSQVAPGNENALRLRVYGSKGGIDWRQEDPNQLIWAPFGKPKQIVTRGSTAAGPAAARVTRIPPGHPEGYLEGFANLYAEIARAIRQKQSGVEQDRDILFPTVHDGVRGLAFIDAAVRSSSAGGVWASLETRRERS